MTMKWSNFTKLKVQKIFEGDIWIEYDFRPEGPDGLALLIVHASGVQREDIIGDHGLLETGAMGPMVNRYRNYHWEYLRRVPFMRLDVETQYVQKNPSGKLLEFACIPKLQQGQWYSLRFAKIENRLYGSIDGKTAFDVTDSPSDGSGPVYEFGRIALRQMYRTKMLYRNLVVYTRNRSNIP